MYLTDPKFAALEIQLMRSAELDGDRNNLPGDYVLGAFGVWL